MSRETSIEIENNDQTDKKDSSLSSPFAFTAINLRRLFDPIKENNKDKNIADFPLLKNYGGIDGLIKGLHSDPQVDLSDETTPLEPITFEEATGNSSQGDGIIEDEQDNVFEEKRLKSIFQLMWIAVQEKVLILLTIAAIVSLGLGLYENFGPASNNPDEPKIRWVEGVAIIIAILIVVLVAPEISRGEPYSYIYSFGVTMTAYKCMPNPTVKKLYKIFKFWYRCINGFEGYEEEKGHGYKGDVGGKFLEADFKIEVAEPPNENELSISHTEEINPFEWFENSIKNKEIPYYDYQDLDYICDIGNGASAEVFSAKLKNAPFDTFAIKRFYAKSTPSEVVHEIRLMKIGSHPNIICFRGVTKLEDPFTKKMSYSLVLEYANNGTLRKYLKKKSENFKWKNQLKFAKEIASAILFLHKNGILHRDLHSKNILVHHDEAIQKDTVKLADFGLSRRLQRSVHYTSNLYGVMAYMDPTTLTFTRNKQNYKLTKKSDIYSLGVIFWELTSGGLSPFESENEKSLVYKILEGVREEPIPNTNKNFVRLYQNCWKQIPGERPNIQEVMDTLSNINSENISDIMVTKPPNEDESTISHTEENPSEWFENSIKNNIMIKKFLFTYIILAMQFYSAKLKNTPSNIFTIRKFYAKSVTINKIIKKIQLMKTGLRPNIIRFYGVTKSKKSKDLFTEKLSYLLILEYVNNRTLRSYLKKNSKILNRKIN